MLREIGKISFPDSMIKRPMEELDEISFSEMKKFTEIGEGILMPVEPLRETATIIRHFRENYDGTGYPDGKAIQEIPVGSRILSVVNDYYALQNGTLVNGTYSASDARNYLVEHKGTKYDPQIVDIFVEQLGDIKDDTEASDKQVVTRQLKVGMKLNKDLVTKNGVLLLSRDYVLGEHMIKQIISLEQSLGEKFVLFVK